MNKKIIIFFIVSVLVIALAVISNNSLNNDSKKDFIDNKLVDNEEEVDKNPYRDDPCPVFTNNTQLEGEYVKKQPKVIENASPSAFLNIPFNREGKIKLAKDLGAYVLGSDNSGDPNSWNPIIKNSDYEEAWYLLAEDDIDLDGIKEKIYGLNIAMTKGPHILVIVKDNKVIFKDSGANIDYHPILTRLSRDDYGFMISTNYLASLPRNLLYTKYKIQDNQIIPVWEQYECALVYEN